MEILLKKLNILTQKLAKKLNNKEKFLQIKMEIKLLKKLQQDQMEKKPLNKPG